LRIFEEKTLPTFGSRTLKMKIREKMFPPPTKKKGKNGTSIPCKYHENCVSDPVLMRFCAICKGCDVDKTL